MSLRYDESDQKNIKREAVGLANHPPTHRPPIDWHGKGATIFRNLLVGSEGLEPSTNRFLAKFFFIQAATGSN